MEKVYKQNYDDDFLQEIEQQCITFVRPVYNLDKDYPVQGSSILVKFESRYFMITAAHILDSFNPNIDCEHADLFLKTNKEDAWLAKLIKGKVTNTHPPFDTRLNDKYDFAYFELNEQALDLLSDYSFLDLDDSKYSSALNAEQSYICFGWLKGESKVNPTTKKLQLHSFTFRSQLAEDKFYEYLKLNHNDHIVLTYDRSIATIFSDSLSYAPHPRGMSGGPILALTNDIIKLAAIGVEFRSYENVIIGTRIEVILDHMRNTLTMM